MPKGKNGANTDDWEFRMVLLGCLIDEASLSSNRIADAIEFEQNDVESGLRYLQDQGCVVQQDDQLFKITDAGKEFVDNTLEKLTNERRIEKMRPESEGS